MGNEANLFFKLAKKKVLYINQLKWDRNLLVKAKFTWGLNNDGIKGSKTGFTTVGLYLVLAL